MITGLPLYKPPVFCGKRERKCGTGFFCEGRLKLTKLGENEREYLGEHAHDTAGQHLIRARRGVSTIRVIRILSAFVVCLCFLAIGALAIAYFALQGRSDQGSALITRIETSIERGLGPNFDVTIGSGETDLSNIGRVSFNAFDIKVNQIGSDATVGSIERVALDANWFSYLFGDAAFDDIQIDGVTLDTSTLVASSAAGLPPHLDRVAEVFGTFLNEVDATFVNNNLKSISLFDIAISGPFLGRLSDEALNIKSLELGRDGEGKVSAVGHVATAHSDIKLASHFSRSLGVGSEFRINMDGVNLREWSVDPYSDERFVAADGVANISGSIKYDELGKPEDPEFQLLLGNGLVRLGKKERSEIASLEINFRAFLKKNQIELDRSFVSIGGFRGFLIGGLKPMDSSVGYGGDVRYDIILERGEVSAEASGEDPVPGAFQASGVFHVSKKRVEVEKLIFATAQGAVTGTASIGLEGETPSIKGELKTDGIQVRALKQFWPFFVASAARRWVNDHIVDGWVDEGTVFADIPSGILFNLHKGAKLKPEHYKTAFEVREFAFRPFGEMPNIENATGNVLLEGMKISAELNSGIAKDSTGKPVSIGKARFVMPDFAAENRTGQTTLELVGDIRAMARISDRKPLRIMERMKTSADQFAGKGYANIVANFPVGRKISYEEVDWNVLLELENGSSTKALEGRKFNQANLLIDANSSGAKVSGKANIDGVLAKIDFTQPIGKSGKVKAVRKIWATLDDADRKKLGFDLSPVVDGPISISIERSNGKEAHTIDFKDAKVSLPWIGWSKGRGIPTLSTFDLRVSKGRYILKNFALKGSGFESQGELVLNNNGLLSADFSKLKLNERDDIRLKIERVKDTYNINANGLSFDTRSIINTLIHSGGFSKAQGSRSVNLVANFETIRGFNNRIMKDAILLYESVNGQLKRLDMTAKGSEGRTYSIQAQLNGNDTLFTMAANDAGNALAFTDIYLRMEGGQLNANLLQTASGPYVGPVTVRGFNVVNEPRLARLATNVNSQISVGRDDIRQEILPNATDRVVSFQLAAAQIERGTGYLNIGDAVIRSSTMGFTATGNVYDAKDRMNLKGTFMPANAVNQAVAAIPIIGQLFSNGRDNALIGITYRLSGQRKNPKLEVNPLSIVTPGVFNKVFEFQ